MHSNPTPFLYQSSATTEQKLQCDSTAFISYAHGDARQIASDIYSLLVTNLSIISAYPDQKYKTRFTPFYDTVFMSDHKLENIKMMKQAIDSSGIFIFIVSQASIMNYWTQVELVRAVAAQKQNSDLLILPIYTNIAKDSLENQLSNISAACYDGTEGAKHAEHLDYDVVKNALQHIVNQQNHLEHPRQGNDAGTINNFQIQLSQIVASQTFFLEPFYSSLVYFGVIDPDNTSTNIKTMAANNQQIEAMISFLTSKEFFLSELKELWLSNTLQQAIELLKKYTENYDIDRWSVSWAKASLAEDNVAPAAAYFSRIRKLIKEWVKAVTIAVTKRVGTDPLFSQQADMKWFADHVRQCLEFVLPMDRANALCTLPAIDTEIVDNDKSYFRRHYEKRGKDWISAEQRNMLHADESHDELKEFFSKLVSPDARAPMGSKLILAIELFELVQLHRYIEPTLLDCTDTKNQQLAGLIKQHKALSDVADADIEVHPDEPLTAPTETASSNPSATKSCPNNDWARKFPSNWALRDVAAAIFRPKYDPETKSSSSSPKPS
ncbi:MAG: hypothetical protein CMF50_00320 [Legionellales bacterium]|nr:hypothetical protein [Legionellales bacterium]